MLKYPQDRHKGHVLLENGKGDYFVTDFKRTYESEMGGYLKFCGAFLVLSKRLADSRIE